MGFEGKTCHATNEIVVLDFVADVLHVVWASSTASCNDVDLQHDCSQELFAFSMCGSLITAELRLTAAQLCFGYDCVSYIVGLRDCNHLFSSDGKFVKSDRRKKNVSPRDCSTSRINCWRGLGTQNIQSCLNLGSGFWATEQIRIFSES